MRKLSKPSKLACVLTVAMLSQSFSPSVIQGNHWPAAPALLRSNSDLLDLGRDAFQAQDWERAIELWREGLAANRQDPVIQEAIGIASLQLQKIDDAIEAFESALEMDPGRYHALIGLGSAYLIKGQRRERAGNLSSTFYAAAQKALMQASSLDPLDVEVMKSLGIANFKLGEWTSAIAILNQAVNSKPDDWVSQFWLARSYTQQGVFDEAFKHFENAKKINPDEWRIDYWHGQAHFQKGYKLDADGHGQWEPYRTGLILLNDSQSLRPNRELWLFNQAVTWFGRGDTEAAIRSLSAAVDIDPKNWSNHLWLGVAYHESGQYDQAAKHLAEARRLGAADQNSHVVLLADSYHKLERYEDAIRVLEPVCRSGSLNWLAHYLLGRAHGAQGDRRQAIASLQNALRYNPTGDVVFYTLGRHYYHLKQFDEAIGFLRKAIQRQSDQWRSHYWLARAYHRSQRVAQAVNSYHRSIELNPEESDTHFYLGIAYRDNEDFETALEHFEKAIQLEPDRELYLHWLGTTHSRMGNQRRAIKYLTKAAELKPGLIRNHKWLGYAYYTLEEFEPARLHLEHAIEIEPDNSRTAKRLAATYQRLGFHDKAGELSRRLQFRLSELSQSSR